MIPILRREEEANPKFIAGVVEAGPAAHGRYFTIVEWFGPCSGSRSSRPPGARPSGERYLAGAGTAHAVVSAGGPLLGAFSRREPLPDRLSLMRLREMVP